MAPRDPSPLVEIGVPVPARGSHGARGQSLVEFTLIVPLLFFLVVAVGDFGRVFVTAIGVESAAREAADYGAFLGSARWDESDTALIDGNYAEMARRACTALSTLPDYQEPAGTLNHATCGTDVGGAFVPYFVFDYARPGGWVSNCSDQDQFDEAPCVIHARVTFEFRTILALPGIPGSITVIRDSWFAVSDLSGS